MMRHGSVLSAGVALFRQDSVPPRVLLLRVYRNWDFPKGRVEPGETPLAAAKRELAEETGVTQAIFLAGEAWRETEPYGSGKVARYYLAVTDKPEVYLPVNPQLGRPEHHAFRWVDCHAAAKLLPARLLPILRWACAEMAAAPEMRRSRQSDA